MKNEFLQSQSRQGCTISRVTAFPLGLLHSASTRSRVNFGWFPDDETILHQLSDVLPCTQHKQGALKATNMCRDKT